MMLWANWMISASLQAGVFLALAAMLDALLAQRELRAAIWYGSLVKLFVPAWFVLSFSIPSSAAASTSMAAGAIDTADWSRLAAWAWLAGVVALAASGLARYRSCRRRLAWNSAEPPAWSTGLVEQLSRRSGLRRTPRVLVQAGEGSPLVVGLWRPVVVIPSSWFDRSAPVRLEHVLLHEFAHIRRCDPWLALACVFVQLIFWFHPLVWLAVRRLAHLRELGCDERAARISHGHAQAYRRTLLQCTRMLFLQPRAAGIALFRRTSSLVARLERLERPLPRPSRWRPVLAASVFAMVLGVGLTALGQASWPRAELPPLDHVQGCLQLRYYVQYMMAKEEQRNGALAWQAESPSRKERQE